MGGSVSAEAVLSELRKRGVEVIATGDRLRFRPAERVTRELRRQLLENKPELLGILADPPTLLETLGGVEESGPSLIASDVSAMPLSEFAEAGLVLRMRSEALDEAVVLASDNATVDPGELWVVYRARELAELLKLDRSSLKQVHQIKKMFRGTVQAS